jgi:hypothetical protein
MSLFSPYVLIAIVIAVLGSYGAGRAQQFHRDEVRWAKKMERIETEKAKAMFRAQEASTVVVTKYVKENGDVIRIFNERLVQLPPPEVVASANAACPVPNWFVGMWNTANQGVLPDPAVRLDAGRSAIVISEVGAAHEREAELCLRKEKQLQGLKNWVRAQCVALNGAPC